MNESICTESMNDCSSESEVECDSEDELSETVSMFEAEVIDQSIDESISPTVADGVRQEEDDIQISSPQMRIRILNLQKTCDRYGVSDRSAAALASSVLQDVGIITTENLSNVIDRSKVRRERQKARSDLRCMDQLYLNHFAVSSLMVGRIEQLFK